jgi:hypothetical protein
MFVDVKKAVSAAGGGMSMKRFSMKGFKRSARTERETERILKEEEQKRMDSQAVGGGPSQTQRQEKEEPMPDASAPPAPTRSIFATATQPASSTFAPTSANAPAPLRTYEMGDIGRTLPRVLLEEGLADPDSSDDEAEASHAVTSDKIYRYMPLPEEYAARERKRVEERKKRVEEERRAAREAGKAPPESDEEEEEEVEEEDGEEDREQWEAVLPEQLSSVYEYGGEFVAVEDMEEGVGELTGLKAGLEIVSFTKMKDVSFRDLARSPLH